MIILINKETALDAVKELEPELVIGTEELLLKRQVLDTINGIHTEIYGFPIEYIIAFACMCREEGITRDDMKTYITTLENAYEYTNKQLEKALLKSIKEMMAKRDGQDAIQSKQ